jgi:hypothetical protein
MFVGLSVRRLHGNEKKKQSQLVIIGPEVGSNKQRWFGRYYKVLSWYCSIDISQR